ncbi:MAG TPA: cytochrome c-type biogenesis protein CcmH, partial [Solirubrobacteraceae bacterium]|nr:cytochrome c-type biogenesis protein CcmH [Solirubrobacteraceae bacterium]
MRLALAVLLLALVPATALPAAPKADLVDVEDEVMCVTCKIPLNIAEGRQPDRQRALIRDLIAEGKTKPQIKQALVAEYGEDVLALPETSGVGVTAYAIPVVLGVVVAVALLLL